jgi:flagellar basal body-associated protein FliL
VVEHLFCKQVVLGPIPRGGSDMKFQNGFSTIVIILLVALVVVVGGGIAAFLYITSNTNPLTQSNAYTPATLDVKVPTPDSETPGFNAPQAATPSVAAITTPPATTPPATNNGSQLGQVDVSTILSTDRKTLGIFFKSSSNFSGINSISYSVIYTTDNGQQNVKGVVTIASETITTDSEGKKSIQKNITVGTCSGGTCTYDANPKNFRVVVLLD